MNTYDSGLMVLLVLGLALVGLVTVLGWIWRRMKRAFWKAFGKWVYPRLTARHQKACDAFNKTWRGKLVRHAPTGRVGLCRCVCTKDRNRVWELFRPRWTVDLIVAPEIARVLSQPMTDGEGRPMIVIMPWLPSGSVERVPVGELTMAPEQDAAEFRRKMEATTNFFGGNEE